MSIDQVKAFTEGLKILSDEFKADSEALAETYKTEVKESADKYAEVAPQVQEAAQQFETASHTFATGMIDRADEYVGDVENLYTSVYGEA
jgi:ElaB/YqjD/DUF883 family membrane-anchored ribosome-binding protein